MSLSKEPSENILERVLKQFLLMLQRRPIVTKSVASAIVSGLGTVISQLIVPDPRRGKGNKIFWPSVLAYTSFGFLVSGPLIHHLYGFMEQQWPKGSKSASLMRLLFDRLIFTPPYLLIFLFYVATVEGASDQAAIQRIKESYWKILKLNWTVWTVVQYINVTYVPLKFRTLFGNFCALIYIVVVSVLRRRSTS